MYSGGKIKVILPEAAALPKVLKDFVGMPYNWSLYHSGPIEGEEGGILLLSPKMLILMVTGLRGHRGGHEAGAADHRRRLPGPHRHPELPAAGLGILHEGCLGAPKGLEDLSKNVLANQTPLHQESWPDWKLFR